MFFSKKKKDADVEKIKEAMNDLPEEFHELPELPEMSEMPDMPEPRYAPRQNYPKDYEVRAAPLFVKVDKYRELLSSVHEMKLYLSSSKQLFSILQDIETVRADALKVLRASLQRMEKSVVEMDSELLRPRGAEFPDEGVREVSQMENSLNDLQKQLMDLKRELQQLK
jgi:vacuolar-type H+-ATPase subunit I/STV1